MLLHVVRAGLLGVSSVCTRFLTGGCNSFHHVKLFSVCEGGEKEERRLSIVPSSSSSADLTAGQISRVSIVSWLDRHWLLHCNTSPFSQLADKHWRLCDVYPQCPAHLFPDGRKMTAPQNFWKTFLLVAPCKSIVLWTLKKKNDLSHISLYLLSSFCIMCWLHFVCLAG